MIYGRIAAARYLFLAVWGVACVFAAPAVAEEATGYAMPSRGRVAAMLTALFHHHRGAHLPGTDSHPLSTSIFASASPEEALERRERGRITAFADSLVYEGGYFPKEIYALMGYDNMTTARVARKVRQLDMALGQRTSPWEVAGRVGRSGSAGSGTGDLWSMQGSGSVRTPGTLALLPVLAVAYAAYPGDGLNAAAQVSVLQDDDMRAEPVGRAAFSLLRQVLVSKRHDKDAWLRRAAADSGDSDSEHEIRAVRVKDWRYLRGEECVMGRMERVVHLWYHGETYSRTMEEGMKFLQSRESLDFLAALAGVTYGREGLPTEVVSSGASDRKLLELVNDLYDLATSEAVLRVTAEEEDEYD